MKQNEQIRIAAYQPGQEFAISELIKKVYDEFVACDYSDQGNRFFYDWIQPEKIAERQSHNRSIRTAWHQVPAYGNENRIINYMNFRLCP